MDLSLTPTSDSQPLNCNYREPFSHWALKCYEAHMRKHKVTRAVLSKVEHAPFHIFSRTQPIALVEYVSRRAIRIKHQAKTPSTNENERRGVLYHFAK